MRRERAWAGVVEACHELGPDDLRMVARVARRLANAARSRPRSVFAPLARSLPRGPDRPRCGARCRSRGGAPCRAPVALRRYTDGLIVVAKLAKRCRMHGGWSSGPKTPEGKARCAEGLARWRERKKAEGREATP